MLPFATERLPDSAKAGPYLTYLLVDSMNDTLRENLLQAIDTSCSCGDVVQAKVGGAIGVGLQSELHVYHALMEK